MPSQLTTPIIPSRDSRQRSYSVTLTGPSRSSALSAKSLLRGSVFACQISSFPLHQKALSPASLSGSSANPFHAIRFRSVHPSLPAPCACATQPPTLRFKVYPPQPLPLATLRLLCLDRTPILSTFYPRTVYYTTSVRPVTSILPPIRYHFSPGAVGSSTSAAIEPELPSIRFGLRLLNDRIFF